MSRPPRLCACGQIVAHGQLCTCQERAAQARKRRHDARRPNSRQRGYTRAWESLRAEFLTLHPCCAFCGVAATVVDHVIPHRGDKALFWNWNNLQSLCKPCHDRDKQRQERAR